MMVACEPPDRLTKPAKRFSGEANRLAGQIIERYAKQDAQGDFHDDDTGEYVSPGGQSAKARVELTGREHGVDWTKPDTRQTMLPKLLAQYQGKKYRNRDKNREITVGKRGIKKVLSHLPDAKPAMLLAKLPEVLESMIWDREEQPREEDRNIRKWHYFKIGVWLDGKPHAAEIKVREDANGDWFYDQSVGPEKNEGSTYKPAASPEGPHSRAAEPSNPSIGQRDEEVKDPKQNYARHLAGQLIERYGRIRPAKGQAKLLDQGPGSGRRQWKEELHPRDSDGEFREKEHAKDAPSWLGKKASAAVEAADDQKSLFDEPSRLIGSEPAGKWLKAREKLHGSDFRRELEGLSSEDLDAALDHVRHRGTAVQQHRLTGPLTAEIRARGLKPRPLPTGSDLALQAVDEGRNLASVRKATGLKAGPEFDAIREQAISAYERMTRPEAHKARRILDQIEDGETYRGQWTKAVRENLGIKSHADLLKAVAAAIRRGDEQYLKRFNDFMSGRG